MLAEGLQSFLAADPLLQTALNVPRSDKTSGIFPMIAPEEVPMPYIVFQQISGRPIEEHFGGTGRLQETRWRFSCYGTTYKQAKALAKTLKLLIIGMNGTIAGGNEVHGVWLQMEADDSEPMPHGTIYASHLDFMLVHIDGDM